MARQAANYGVETMETTGWVPYPIPEDVQLSIRMHLTEDMVKQLIVKLEGWFATGNLS